MERQELLLTNQDYVEFRDWIQLNLEGVTWQGRFTKQFEEFWGSFFLDGLSLSQMMERFHYAYQESKIGPLASWFNWLREKFISFIYINKNISIYELSKQIKKSPPEVASILRNFFVEAYPHREEDLSEVFQVGNLSSHNLDLIYEDVSRKIQVDDALIIGSHADEIMPSMEVTLYEEWDVFLKKMQKDLYNPHLNVKKIRSNASLKRNFKYVGEFLGLLVIGSLIIMGLRALNLYWETRLVDKIEIYEPKKEWLSKSFIPQSFDDLDNEILEYDVKDINEVDNVTDTLVIPDEEKRFETDSEVTLASLDDLPRDIEAADLEQSSYEEQVKQGYRDTRYGSTKVYRVLMKSVDPSETREKIENFVDRYKVIQVDNVKPGQAVPGGIYYNVYVPREYLKEFLVQVMAVEESILYESRTRSKRNPPGKNKVFIWVKSI